MQYDKTFKEEAVRLSDENGPKKAAEQLAFPTIRCPIGAAQNPVTGNRLFREAEKHGFQKKQRNNGSANWKKKTRN